MKISIAQFTALSDNYGYLLHDEASGQTASIDTPDAVAINDALEQRGWQLTHIWNTHHHHDHVGGNLALQQKWGCEIVGPAGEQSKIPGIAHALDNGDTAALGTLIAQIISVPGHTLGHIVYVLPNCEITLYQPHQTTHYDGPAAFVGDTVFALGCGRVFEGTMAQMHSSLSKIAALAPNTLLFCAHEYTQANARFALSIEPNFDPLIARNAQIDAARANGQPTVPSLLSSELSTNPFLRTNSATLQNAVNMDGAAPAEVFAHIRALKDKF